MSSNSVSTSGQGSAPSAHAYRRLLTYVAPRARGWAGMLVMTIVGTALGVLEPWPLKVVVDHVLGEAPVAQGLLDLQAWLPGAESKRGLLAWSVGAGLVIFLLGTLINAWLTLAWTSVGRSTVYDLARDLFARIQRRSLPFHARQPVGDSLSRITGDSWCVHTVLDTLFFSPGHALLAVAGMVVTMWYIDPGLTLMALAVAPFMSAAGWLFGEPLRATAHVRREIEARIQAHVQQTLRGIPVVQAFVREDLERERFMRNAAAAIRAHQRGALVESAYGLGSGLVTTIGTAAVIWVAATRVLQGELTIGSTLVFLSYLGTLQGQLATFVSVYTTWQTAGASVDRVIEVLDSEERVVERRGAQAMPGGSGEVRIERVVFGYDPGRPVLDDVTIDVRPGETVAIVGHTGAGKSTLVSLVPRFFDPQRGRVLVNGHDVRDVTLDSLRAQIAIVLQESLLFPISIAANIRYGRPAASLEDVQAAAQAARAHQFIMRLPEGYDTILGESGATLSGGERQRISIARALLRDAPILILDEPTSALDVETEHALLDALDRLMRGRTTFVIAHRLSTIRRATKIVVLDRGTVVEQGTHEELLRSGRAYACLHALQFPGGDGATPLA